METRLRVIELQRGGLSLPTIQKELKEEDISMSIVSLCKLDKKFSQTSSVTDQKTYKTPKIFKEEHLRFIDKTMASNPELTGTQLAALIQEQFSSLKPSISTVKRARKELGWVSKKTRYCALISEVNCAKRVTWCEERKALKDLEFGDVIWTDKCTAQQEPHRKRYFHKEGQPPRLTGKPKHAPKVNNWGEISQKGATSIDTYAGILTATRYTDILDAALLPFVGSKYGSNHRFQKDSDHKHTSRWT